MSDAASPRGGTAETRAPSASPRRSRVLVGRTVVAVEVIAIACVPFAVFAVISGEVAASSWAMMTAITVLLNLLYGGRAIAWITVGLLTALTPVGIVCGPVPVAGAGLMAIMCFGVGLSSAKGVSRGLLLIPMFVSFLMVAPPPWSGHTGDDLTSTSYLLWNMLFWGGGALWGALVFPPLLRKWKMPPGALTAPWAREDTVIYTITITVLTTGCTLAVLAWLPGSDSAWLVLTVLAVTGAGVGSTTVKRMWHRVAGTLVGVVIAASVASVVDSEAVLLAIALVLAVILVVVGLSRQPYFLWTVFVTPTVVLLTSTSIADVDTTDAERLGFTLTGALLVLVASGITLGWAHYQQAHGPSAAVESQVVV